MGQRLSKRVVITYSVDDRSGVYKLHCTPASSTANAYQSSVNCDEDMKKFLRRRKGLRTGQVQAEVIALPADRTAYDEISLRFVQSPLPSLFDSLEHMHFEMHLKDEFVQNWSDLDDNASQTSVSSESDWDEDIKQAEDDFESDWDEEIRQAEDYIESDWDEEIRQAEDHIESDWDEEIQQAEDEIESDWDEDIQNAEDAIESDWDEEIQQPDDTVDSDWDEEIRQIEDDIESDWDEEVQKAEDASDPNLDEDTRKAEVRQSEEKQEDDKKPSVFIQEINSCLYEIGEMLGEGGFGEVFAGTRVQDGLKVAVKYAKKTKRLDYISIPGHPEPLPREVALHILACEGDMVPEIIQLLDWQDYQDHYIMVLERPSPCKDLNEFIAMKEAELEEEFARDIMRQATTAAYMSCERGVFHRDIKLENLLIRTDTMNVKLIDFGCGDLLKKSIYKTFTGSRDYASPEYLETGEYHGKPATVYSLGVVLFAMLCRRFPSYFDLDLINDKTWSKDGLTEECCSLLQACLQQNPDERILLENILDHAWF